MQKRFNKNLEAVQFIPFECVTEATDGTAR